MFRRRRASLIRRLWRLASRVDAQRHARALLKRLDVDQLDALLVAKESGGADCGACVFLPSDSDTVSPALVMCRLLRWPDVESVAQLKRLNAICRQQDEVFSLCCCNPFHWSRVCDTGTTPLAHGRLVGSDDSKDDEWTNQTTESLETGGTLQTCSTDADGNALAKPWCHIAYWELRQRIGIGRLLANRQDCLAVFGSTAAAQDGFCLTALAAQHPPQNEAVQKTRLKIGLGMFLWRDSQGVWLYNRSSNPLFINSPTLDPPGPGPLSVPRNPRVYKISPGYSARIFDPERARWYQQVASGASRRSAGSAELEPEGPFNPLSIRISFAKGWGSNYARQCITTCPCWLEILISSS